LTKAQVTAKNNPADHPFNYYVRRNSDSTMLIWAVTSLPGRPATECRGYYYISDKSGSWPVLKNEYQSFDDLSTPTPARLRITYSQTERPPLTAIFYALEYSNTFRHIEIETSTMRSVLNYDNGGKWIHSVTGQ
jgi:hypothetical protein